MGPDADELSSSTIARLKSSWWDEYEAWRRRDLSGKRHVYIWADGVYFKPRLDDDRQCMLAIIGADEYEEKTSDPQVASKLNNQSQHFKVSAYVLLN